MIQFRRGRTTEQDLIPDAIKYLDSLPQKVKYTTITPDKADEASKVNSKSMVLVSFKRNESGYFEIQVMDKGFYRYTKKLIGDQCKMRITDSDERSRTITAEDDHLGKVLNVIELLAIKYDLSIVKGK